MAPIRRGRTIRLDDELYEGMDYVWQRDGVQPSEQVRRALRQWLQSRGVKIKETSRRGSIPRGKSRE
jgi:metal-responsive CopG/Arc/MetJ family transcriptional regulator